MNPLITISIITAVFLAVIAVSAIFGVILLKNELIRTQQKLSNEKEENQILSNELTSIEYRKKALISKIDELDETLHASVLETFHLLKSGEFFLKINTTKEDEPPTSKMTTDIRDASYFPKMEEAIHASKVYGGTPIEVYYVEKKALTGTILEEI